MLRSRLVRAVVALCGLVFAACQTPAQSSGEQPAVAAPKVIEVAGVDTSKMTEREREQWSTLVGELLAPCPDQPVSLAQCVAQKRSCSACLPAATFLTNQVTRGKTRSQAEAAFRARFAPEEVKDIDVGDSPGKGAKEPVVTIVEWADFECPFCGVAQPLLSQVVQRHPDTVRLVFKHYPLSMHQDAEGAARAAVAAGMQGKFWELHSLFFQNQEGLNEAGLEKLAKQAGLDVTQFNTDRKSEAVADRVATDRKQADGFGLKGTPTIYINGRSFDLEKFDLAEDLEAWIELEVTLRAGTPTPGTTNVKATTSPSTPSVGTGAAKINDAPKPANSAAAKGGIQVNAAGQKGG